MKTLFHLNFTSIPHNSIIYFSMCVTRGFLYIKGKIFGFLYTTELKYYNYEELKLDVDRFSMWLMVYSVRLGCLLVKLSLFE